MEKNCRRRWVKTPTRSAIITDNKIFFRRTHLTINDINSLNEEIFRKFINIRLVRKFEHVS